MARDTALVDDVIAVASSAATTTRKRAGSSGAGIRVKFSGGEEALLDAGDPRHTTWAEVLKSLQDTRQPAYVEIDPRTRHITSLLIPRAVLVTAMRNASLEGVVEVELEISHARHFLRRSHPEFSELQKLLETARLKRMPVLVTESIDGAEIVDVRPISATGAKRRT